MFGRGRNNTGLLTIVSALLLLLASASAASAQEPESETQEVAQPSGLLRVYLDCSTCDFDHVRREIPYVNYVRDPEQADVHVFITDEETGGGGIQYELSFIGRGHFERVQYTFGQTVERNATELERREAVTEAIRLGLVPYVVQTETTGRFSLGYSGEVPGAADGQSVDDPWNHWVFTAYVGDVRLDLESNRTVFDSRWGLYADHVSEDWKLRLRPYFNYDYVEVERDDEPDVTSSISRHGFDSYAIRSLGPHWSAGLFGTYVTRNDENLRHWGEVAPGVEYSILPYEQATRRAVTVVYQLGLIYADYFDETIFNQTEESLLRQRLAASVAIRQPWGEIHGGLEGSHYFHDFSKRRAEFFGLVSVRLLEGLSVVVQGEFEMIRDQLSLPLGDASLEDILLQQRQLATDFELSASIALTYTFGSRFTNIVNTRF